MYLPTSWDGSVTLLLSRYLVSSLTSFGRSHTASTWPGSMPSRVPRLITATWNSPNTSCLSVTAMISASTGEDGARGMMSMPTSIFSGSRMSPCSVSRAERVSSSVAGSPVSCTLPVAVYTPW